MRISRLLVQFLMVGVSLSLSGCQRGPDFEIEYESYELENGLQVVLHEDRSDPIAAVAVLYRRIGGRGASVGLAAVLYALSIGHVNCVVSVAGRGLLQAAVFGVLAMLFHDRWRRDGWRWGAVLAPLSLIVFVRLYRRLG